MLMAKLFQEIQRHRQVRFDLTFLVMDPGYNSENRAQIQTMMPKLHSTNFEGMELIRPLYLVRESDICAWRM